MSALVKERLEAKANSMALPEKGFHELGSSGTLVMGTPGFTVTIAAYAVATSTWTAVSQFFGGPERAIAASKEGAEESSLNDLLGLYEKG